MTIASHDFSIVLSLDAEAILYRSVGAGTGLKSEDVPTGYG